MRGRFDICRICRTATGFSFAIANTKVKRTQEMGFLSFFKNSLLISPFLPLTRGAVLLATLCFAVIVTVHYV